MYKEWRGGLTMKKLFHFNCFALMEVRATHEEDEFFAADCWGFFLSVLEAEAERDRLIKAQMQRHEERDKHWQVRSAFEPNQFLVIPLTQVTEQDFNSLEDELEKAAELMMKGIGVGASGAVVDLAVVPK